MHVSLSLEADFLPLPLAGNSSAVIETVKRESAMKTNDVASNAGDLVGSVGALAYHLTRNEKLTLRTAA